MKLSKNELNDHYEFYVDNCTGDEIPISFDEWKREYQADLEAIMGEDDLFEQQSTLPKKVLDLIAKHGGEHGDDFSIQSCRSLAAALRPIGYVFDYSLDAVPYQLRRLKA